MDPARQSAIVGAVLGAATVVMGAAIVAIGLGFTRATLYAPAPIVVGMGLGLMLVGATFAVATLNMRLALLLAIPGATLTFLIPTAWAAMSKAGRECTVQFFSHGAASPAFALDSATCGWVIAGAAVLTLLVILGMAFAWTRARR
jgi:hypothetical protein